MRDDPLLLFAGIAAVGVLAQWIAWRMRVPSILVLLLVGAIAGGSDLLDPDELLGDLLFPVVSLSVALILFEGSLALGRRDLRLAGRTVTMLTTVGAAVTFGALWVVARSVLDISDGVAALIAANLIVTGPTVIGPLMQQVRPRGRTGPILRSEGIIIDPIGAALAIVVYELIVAGHLDDPVLEAIGAIAAIGLVGALVGVVGAFLLGAALAEFWLPDQLRQPAVVASVLVTFAVANHFQEESGLVAVTVLGLVLANQRRVDVETSLDFVEKLQVLVLSSLFLLLAARLDFDAVREDLGGNLLLLAAAIFVVRPLAVAASTVRSGLTWRERVFLAGVAPRGIVAAAIASIFALRLDEASIAGSAHFTGAVITVIVGTIIFYGFTARWLGKVLHIAEGDRRGVLIVGAHPWGIRLSEVLQAQGLRTLLIDSDRAKVVTARLSGRDTVHDSVLSERVRDELDLEGIGHMLALTSSTEINELAVNRLGGHFGLSHTWRMRADMQVSGRPLAWPSHAEIQRRIDEGATIRATQLSQRFNWNDYLELHDEVSPLLLVRDGRLVLPEDGDELSPRPGDTLVALSLNGSPSDQR